MDFFFSTFSAVFLLFASTSCAPTAPPLLDPCALVRDSSLALNRVAGNVSVRVRFHLELCVSEIYINVIHFLINFRHCKFKTLKNAQKNLSRRSIFFLFSQSFNRRWLIYRIEFKKKKMSVGTKRIQSRGRYVHITSLDGFERHLQP